MKQKQLTHQQLEKKALRKQKEIAKWEKEKARPKRGYYIIYLIFISQPNLVFHIYYLDFYIDISNDE